MNVIVGNALRWRLRFRRFEGFSRHRDAAINSRPRDAGMEEKCITASREKSVRSVGRRDVQEVPCRGLWVVGKGRKLKEDEIRFNSGTGVS